MPPALIGDLIRALDRPFRDRARRGDLARSQSRGLDSRRCRSTAQRRGSSGSRLDRRASIRACSAPPGSTPSSRADRARRSPRPARSGFRSVNLDLIFGTPGETVRSWSDTLDRAITLEPDHVSCYALTVEPGTELGRAVAAGAPAPDPDLQADFYEMACERLAEAGLVRYEVSNWARPGHTVRYNLAVWAQAEYLAFGMGAHRFRDGIRSHNRRLLDGYLAAIEGGVSPTAGSEVIEGWAAEVERVFLGIRRVAGVVAGSRQAPP